MNIFDLLAVGGAGLVTCGFALARFGEPLFVVIGVVTLIGATLAAFTFSGPLSGAVLLIAGLALYFFGLGIVRVMLHRSVSLRMLAAFKTAADVEGSGDDIRSRLVDLERYRLASCERGLYQLTRFGGAIAGTVAVLYQVTGESQ
jgi:hypothetical protein